MLESKTIRALEEKKKLLKSAACQRGPKMKLLTSQKRAKTVYFSLKLITNQDLQEARIKNILIFSTRQHFKIR
jgi:hypothetical protein